MPWNLQTYGSSGSHGFTAYGSIVIHSGLQNMNLQIFHVISMDLHGSIIIHNYSRWICFCKNEIHKWLVKNALNQVLENKTRCFDFGFMTNTKDIQPSTILPMSNIDLKHWYQP
jgi:hypothetical protein